MLNKSKSNYHAGCLLLWKTEALGEQEPGNWRRGRVGITEHQRHWFVLQQMPESSRWYPHHGACSPPVMRQLFPSLDGHTPNCSWFWPHHNLFTCTQHLGMCMDRELKYHPKKEQSASPHALLLAVLLTHNITKVVFPRSPTSQVNRLSLSEAKLTAVENSRA